jgi:hypothetical protein
MCLGGRPSTPAPTNVKDNSMYYNGNIFDPKPEEELETETNSMGTPVTVNNPTTNSANSSGLTIADASSGFTPLSGN